MGSSLSADEIAEELRDALSAGAEAFIAVLRTRFAPQVEVAHEPAAPGDGLVDSKAFCDQMMAMIARIPAFGLDGDIGVRDDVITFAMVMSGELPDGTRLSLSDPAEYHVAAGRIVSSHSRPDPAAAERMQRLLAASIDASP